MRKDLAISPMEFTSSFLSCEKDLETILRKLFIESEPYSTYLKKLLVINTKDCLDNTNSQVYKDSIKNLGIAELKEKGYIRLQPRVKFKAHQDVKSYLIITFDNFITNFTNPKFRDCDIFIDVICNTEYWDLGGFRYRPIKICGYIDAILNNSKLSGIGTLEFGGCKEFTLDENLSGYTLSYRAIHGSDDILPTEHGWLTKK